jgi:hypothetical protein
MMLGFDDLKRFIKHYTADMYAKFENNRQFRSIASKTVEMDGDFITHPDVLFRV